MKKILIIMLILFMILPSLTIVNTNATSVSDKEPVVKILYEQYCQVGSIIMDNKIHFYLDPSIPGTKIDLIRGNNILLFIDYKILDTFTPDEKWTGDLEVTYGSLIETERFSFSDPLIEDNTCEGHLQVIFKFEDLLSLEPHKFSIKFNFGLADGTVYSGSTETATLDFVDLAPTEPRIKGVEKIKVNMNAQFITSASDIEGDNIEFGWDWNGDKVVDEWTTKEYRSKEDCYASHAWDKTGEYVVRVKARDTYHKFYKKEGPWSEPITVSVVKIKDDFKTFNFNFIQNIFKFLYN